MIVAWMQGVRLVSSDHHMTNETDPITAAMRSLVDDYRTRCLWFLRPDYYPMTRNEHLKVLDYVQRYGDRAAHVRAATVRAWLFQTSSVESAD